MSMESIDNAKTENTDITSEPTEKDIQKEARLVKKYAPRRKPANTQKKGRLQWGD